jgi:hypothetical protein
MYAGYSFYTECCQQRGSATASYVAVAVQYFHKWHVCIIIFSCTGLPTKHKPELVKMRMSMLITGSGCGNQIGSCRLGCTMLPMAVQTHPTELSMLKVTNFQGGEHRVVLEREREREEHKKCHH